MPSVSMRSIEESETYTTYLKERTCAGARRWCSVRWEARATCNCSRLAMTSRYDSDAMRIIIQSLRE